MVSVVAGTRRPISRHTIHDNAAERYVESLTPEQRTQLQEEALASADPFLASGYDRRCLTEPPLLVDLYRRLIVEKHVTKRRYGRPLRSGSSLTGATDNERNSILLDRDRFGDKWAHIRDGYDISYLSCQKSLRIMKLRGKSLTNRTAIGCTGRCPDFRQRILASEARVSAGKAEAFDSASDNRSQRLRESQQAITANRVGRAVGPVIQVDRSDGPVWISAPKYGSFLFIRRQTSAYRVVSQ